MSDQIRNALRILQNENARLKEENQSLRQEVTTLRDIVDAMRTLQEIVTSIDENTDVLMLLDRILQAALTTIDATDGSLLLVDDETNELVFVVVYGAVRETLVGHRIPLGDGIAGWVAQNKKPVIIPNVRLDPRFSTAVDQMFSFQTRSMLCVPLLAGDRVLGVIQSLNKMDGETFNDADLALLGVVAQLAATAMAKAIAVVPEKA